MRFIWQSQTYSLLNKVDSRILINPSKGTGFFLRFAADKKHAVVNRATSNNK